MGNVWDALARELRELKRQAEDCRDRLDTINERMAELSAKIEEQRKGASDGPVEKDPFRA